MAIEVLSRLRLPIAPVLPDEVARKADLISGDTVNYSLTPVDTLVKWVDGSAIFRRVFVAVAGTAVNTDNAVVDIPGGWGFNGIVRLDGYCITLAGLRIPIGYYGAPADYFSATIDEDGVIFERHGMAAVSSRPIILIIDYISQPTGLSSWDGGTSVWDGGASTWDQLVRQLLLERRQRRLERADG